MATTPHARNSPWCVRTRAKLVARPGVVVTGSMQSEARRVSLMALLEGRVAATNVCFLSKRERRNFT
jgi:hypothetical protein